MLPGCGGPLALLVGVWTAEPWQLPVSGGKGALVATLLPAVCLTLEGGDSLWQGQHLTMGCPALPCEPPCAWGHVPHEQGNPGDLRMEGCQGSGLPRCLVLCVGALAASVQSWRRRSLTFEHASVRLAQPVCPICSSAGLRVLGNQAGRYGIRMEWSLAVRRLEQSGVCCWRRGIRRE